MLFSVQSREGARDFGKNMRECSEGTGGVFRSKTLIIWKNREEPRTYCSQSCCLGLKPTHCFRCHRNPIGVVRGRFTLGIIIPLDPELSNKESDKSGRKNKQFLFGHWS